MDRRPVTPTPIDADAVPCRKDPERMFPTASSAVRAHQDAAAKAVCRTGNGGKACPAIDPCLAYAMHTAVEGIWAATTVEERQEIRERTGVVAIPVIVSQQTMRHMQRRSA